MHGRPERFDSAVHLGASCALCMGLASAKLISRTFLVFIQRCRLRRIRQPRSSQYRQGSCRYRTIWLTHSTKDGRITAHSSSKRHSTWEMQAENFRGETQMIRLRLFVILLTLLSALSIPAAAQVPPHAPGSVCFTPYFWCWVSPPGPPGYSCWCIDSYGYQVMGTLG